MALITSENRLEYRFQGYCFVGTDLVIGQAGAEQYIKHQCEPIFPGHDGCYFTLFRDKGKWRIGVDSRGLRRLFIYQQDGKWAISTSLFELVSHLRSTGVKLTPHEANVESYRTARNLTLQQQTSRTVFNEIRLVPSFRTLEMEFETWVEVDTPPQFSQDYESGLSNYVTTMQNRTATLLSSSQSNVFEIDLSGGLDSRTVFSFFLHAGIRNIDQQRYRVGSTVTLSKDFRAAQTIAERCKIRLNTPTPPRAQPPNQTIGFNYWRENSLGVYTPPYFHTQHSELNRFKAHGAGGGNNRQIHSFLSFSRMLDSYSNSFSGKQYDQWREEVLTTMRDLQKSRPHVNPFLLHYREFRNRFHFGHEPHTRMLFTPLNSILLDYFMDQNPGRGNNQLYFDIMETNYSGLSLLPYDSPSKSPSMEEEESTLILDVPDPIAGRIFRGTDPDSHKSLEENGNSKTRWLNLVEQAVSPSDSAELFDQETIKQVESALGAARAEAVALKTHSPSTVLMSYTILKRFAFDDTFEVDGIL